MLDTPHLDPSTLRSPVYPPQFCYGGRAVEGTLDRSATEDGLPWEGRGEYRRRCRSAPLACAALLIWLGMFAVAARAQTNVAVPPAAEILKTLRQEHPRLLATKNDFAELRKRMETNTRLKDWRRTLRERAENIISEPPSKYEIPDGLRLLGTSRRVLNRVQTLGLLYQLEREKRYAERAWTELEAAAKFPDWNPRHFLDTAEMTHAFALGYDWFYDAWTADQRHVLRAALVEKGLNPARAVHRGTARTSRWPQMRHNWNQVCNGGITLGALALAEEEPALAGELLHAGLNSVLLAMVEFAPDGAWQEGPGYWNYATSYNVAMLAGLESALGTDFGLSRIPGFAECGTFPLYITGPIGKTFNYADGSDSQIRAPQMFWLAKKFHRPEYANYEAKAASPHPLDFLWEDALPIAGPAPALDKYFRGAEVVTMRSAWNDRDALFVGFKGGDNKANHSHLDLGSFVLDALGVRWVVDLGADDYNLPGYFGAQRWTYYRLRAEGHNTLVINPAGGPDQDPKAAAKIIHYESRPDGVFAVSDLTAAYAAQARDVKRGIAMLDRQQFLVQDELKCSPAAEVFWFLHTPAEATLSAEGTLATLSIGKQHLAARIVSPANAKFTVLPAVPLSGSPHPEKQNDNHGVRKLAIRLAGATDLRLAVWLVPLREGESAPSNPPPLRPLSDWPSRPGASKPGGPR
jgi:hypothetical protein